MEANKYFGVSLEKVTDQWEDRHYIWWHGH